MEHKNSSIAKVRNKIKNLPYTIRARKLCHFVKTAPLKNGISQEKRAQKIILSLTTYQARFASIPLCLKSLLLQTVKPNKIILYLDSSEEAVPQEIKQFTQYGLTIKYGVEDLKPHKKYYFAMQAYPEDIVVTVDDDVLYPPNMLESLLATYTLHPDCVCARRVHKMTFYEDGRIRPYAEWEEKCTSVLEPSYSLVPTGVGGVLYPPHCLDERVFNKDIIRSSCLMADDIWLKTMALLKGTKTVWAKNKILTPPYTEHSQNVSLYLSNVHQNKNDIYVQNMVELFGTELKNKGTSKNCNF